MVFALAALHAGGALAAACVSQASGNWNAPATWTACGGTFPGAADTVTINGGFNVTVNVANAAATSVQLGGTTAGSGNGTLTFNAGSALAVSGAVTFGNGARNGLITMTAGGTLSVGSFAFTGGTWTPGTGTVVMTATNTLPNNTNIDTFNNFTVSGGTTTLSRNTTINGDLTVANGTTWNGAGNTVALGGNLLANGTFTAGAGVYTLSGAGDSISGTAAITIPSLTVNGTYTNWNTLTVSTALAGTGTLTNGDATHASAVLNIGDAAIAAGTTLVASATGNTVNYNLAGAQTIKLPTGGNYYNLTFSGSGNKTLPAGTVNILNDLTIGAGTTYLGSTNNPTVNLRGNFISSGTFTSGTGVFTFNSTTAVQSISGTPTFSNLTINNTGGGISAGTDVTVSTTLTLTAGIVNAGANTVILSNTAAAALAGGSAASYVIGCLRKSFAAAGVLNFRAAGQDEFPVGIAGSYLPVEFTAGTTSTAGTLTVCPVGSDHPSMSLANGGQINTAKSLNRYWATTSVTLNTSAALANAIFKFPNGATEYDAGAAPGNFIVERWNGTLWNPTTLVAAGGTSTQAQNIDLTGATNDFAIGEPFPGFTGNPGRFNAFETSTAANSLIGRIFTKLVATNFSLDIVSINAGRTAYGGAVANVTVNILDSSDNSGALNAATACRATWNVVQTITAALNIPAGGRVTLNNINVTQARRDARIQLIGGGNTACSTDTFSIRPTAFSVSSTNATNLTTVGAPAFKTGASFNLTATALAGYDGTPAIDNTKVVGTLTAGTIGGAFSAAPIASGVASGAAFTYSEVGNFGLNTDGVTDASFTSVDPANDCVTGSTSTVLSGSGKYGCSIGSNAVAAANGLGFGRFFPDHFTLIAGSTLTNRTAAGCGGTFTYLNEGLTLAITVQARNSADVLTVNYAGAYAKNDPTTGGTNNPTTAFGLGARSGTTNLTPRITSLYQASAPVWAGGILAATGTHAVIASVGRATPDNPDGPFASTSFGIAMTDTDSVAMNAFDLDVDNNTVNEHKNLGVSTELRFGRLRVQGAMGSEKLPLQIPMEVQYWAGGFATNTLDSCTSIPQSAIALTFNPLGAAPPPNLAACETAFPAAAVTFVSGIAPAASTTLAAPGTGNDGPLRITVNLGSAGGNYCPSVGGAFTPATSAGFAYLLGRWNDNPATGGDPDGNANTNYDDKPSAIGTFGLYTQPSNFIFFRENY